MRDKKASRSSEVEFSYMSRNSGGLRESMENLPFSQMSFACFGMPISGNPLNGGSLVTVTTGRERKCSAKTRFVITESNLLLPAFIIRLELAGEACPVRSLAHDRHRAAIDLQHEIRRRPVGE